jgi:Glyoxalase/Bleomycin resistance protein/Dioxygenase superfamily
VRTSPRSWPITSASRIAVGIREATEYFDNRVALGFLARNLVFDPVPVLQRVTCPVPALFGSDDTLVAVPESVVAFTTHLQPLPESPPGFLAMVAGVLEGHCTLTDPQGVSVARWPSCVTSSTRSGRRSTSTSTLGFTLEQRMGPAFAIVSRGDLTLWLSGPQSSAARPMPDGRQPEAGGWNRLVITVDDLEARVEELKQAGLTFRNEIVTGPGGKQILLEDSAGNPVELFEPA